MLWENIMEQQSEGCLLQGHPSPSFTENLPSPMFWASLLVIPAHGHMWVSFTKVLPNPLSAASPLEHLIKSFPKDSHCGRN